jgi:Ca-activated chloride channel family protein
MPNPRIALAAILIPAVAVHAQPPDFSEGGLFLRTPTVQYQQATQLKTEVDIDVVGIVARVSVKQRFRNQSADWVEGIYVFPLPDDSAVDELSMTIGSRRIEGEIQEREEAKKTYEQARAAGQHASLVEQERPNLFTTSVANIAPGQEIVIDIGYLQTARYDEGLFSLRVPMTLTPRFTPPSVPDAARITPPVLVTDNPDSKRATIAITVDAGMPLAEIGSSSHALTSVYDGRRYELTTADASVPMDRDLVVDWRVVPDQTPRAAAFTETVAGESFVLLMFLPPTTAELPALTPRELIFVIDTSGSMSGTSIREARSALASGLDRLTSADRFNVVEFNSEARSLYAEPVVWTPQSSRKAHDFVHGLETNGGTNIAAAITAVLDQPTAPGFLRQIVFITDGSVGNEAKLFQMIHDELGDARLFTVGIGSAPNTHFMRKAAQFGRGTYSHIARAEDVDPRMSALFEKIGHVALKDIDVSWPNAVEVYPERVPDLYRGEPVVLAARMNGTLTRTISVDASGMVGPYGWTQRVDVVPGNSRGVASIWARRKIESLLDRKLEGDSPDSIRDAVVEVALAYGMLSPYTSLVAVDRTPEHTRNARLRREALGNLLPAGSDYGALRASLPATATDARWYQLIGIVIAALVLGLVGIWRLLTGPGR